MHSSAGVAPYPSGVVGWDSVAAWVLWPDFLVERDQKLCLTVGQGCEFASLSRQVIKAPCVVWYIGWGPNQAELPTELSGQT